MIARGLKRLLRIYVALTGAVTAYTVGLLDRYTAEHRRFLASGFVCGACKEFLIKKTLVADVMVLDASGNSVPLLLARLKGKYFVCPRCGHRWELRRTKRLA
ncbi:MAG: hypothetical protein U0795_01465 [Pirellulales bacterium]